MFVDDASRYSTFGSTLYHLNSGRPGDLVLVATDQNVAFANMPHARSLAAKIDAANPRDRARLQRDYDAARTAHSDGVVDWHDVVLYIVRNVAFLYDPSALSVGDTSGGSGKEVVRQGVTTHGHQGQELFAKVGAP